MLLVQRWGGENEIRALIAFQLRLGIGLCMFCAQSTALIIFDFCPLEIYIFLKIRFRDFEKIKISEIVSKLFLQLGKYQIFRKSEKTCFVNSKNILIRQNNICCMKKKT